MFILKSKFLWKIFGPIISSATKKSDVLKKATWSPWVLFNYFVYTLFKQVPMATFPRLSTFADVRSPSRWRPTHSRPQSRLANFIFHQCASPFSFFSITWLSIGHASISACLYTWSQNPLSLVLFAPPLSCFGTRTITELWCLILYGRLSQEFTNGNNTQGNLLHCWQLCVHF